MVIFPDALKIENVTQTSKTCRIIIIKSTGNISVACILKTFRKCIRTFVDTFDTINYFSVKETGFQCNSTEHAVIHLLNNISHALDKGECRLGVFTDLSLTFDTVSHNRLCDL